MGFLLLMISGTVTPDIVSAIVGVIDMVVRATARFPRWRAALFRATGGDGKKEQEPKGIVPGRATLKRVREGVRIPPPPNLRNEILNPRC